MTTHTEREGDGVGAAQAVGWILDGRYRLEELIGRGGMGEVYRAVQLNVARPVAIKLLADARVADDAARARFEQEARALAALKHPHIVQLHDFGELPEGGAYLVMELVDGEPLAAVIARDAPLAPARAMHILAQLARALEAAHQQHLVHRDLKPSNVLLTAFGDEADYVKLIDFGIAKVAGLAATSAGLTSSEVLVGSPRYASPEQATQRPVTAQSDLYALGTIAYEMLTGRPVFAAESAMELLIAHATEPVPPLSVDGRPLSGPLIALVSACLAKEPWERPPSARAVLEALDAASAAGAGDLDAPEARPGESGGARAERAPAALPAAEAERGESGDARPERAPAAVTLTAPASTRIPSLAPGGPPAPTAASGTRPRPEGRARPAAAAPRRRRASALRVGAILAVLALAGVGTSLLVGPPAPGTPDSGAAPDAAPERRVAPAVDLSGTWRGWFDPVEQIVLRLEQHGEVVRGSVSARPDGPTLYRFEDGRFAEGLLELRYTWEQFGQVFWSDVRLTWDPALNVLSGELRNSQRGGAPSPIQLRRLPEP